jgi:hypothetical protein
MQAILQKKGHTEGKSHTREGGWKEVIKNMVDVFHIKEWI